jgi:kumamolisin
VGFLNPLLYAQLANANALHDITTGNNDITGRIGGYSAGPGWDPCTGYGSPKGSAIGAALAGANAATPGP